MSDVAEKEPWNMSVAERVEFAKQMKENGRRYFLDGLVEDAMESYRSGLKRLIPAYDLPHDLLLEVNSLKLSFYLNIAACQIKLGLPEHVVKNCSKALCIDNRNIKAFYRRSVAWTEINEFEKAREDIKAGLLIDENNKTFKVQLAKIDIKCKEENIKYNGMLKKCLSG